MPDEPRKIFDLMDTETEPTDEQLAELMHYVGEAVRAETAEINEMARREIAKVAETPAPLRFKVVSNGSSASVKPELVIVAGPNGSGKTTMTKELLRHFWAEHCRYINPDEIAQNDFGGWDSPQASLKAAQKAEILREECLAQRRSLVFETVFSATDKIEFVKKANHLGYFIRLFFICTDSPLINVNRISRRRLKGGHDVPPAKILSRYSKSIANCVTATKLVDRAYIYDNSVDDADPQLLFRTENGALKKVYREPVNDWARPIFLKCSER